MTKRWTKYDFRKRYPNLEDRFSNDSVVDIMLDTGEIVFMCILQRYTDFWCIEKYRNRIPDKKVVKIRLTHKEIKRYKRHHWGSHPFCLRCKKPRTIPAPKECDIIWYYNYQQAHPNYVANKKPNIPFNKTNQILLPTY